MRTFVEPTPARLGRRLGPTTHPVRSAMHVVEAADGFDDGVESSTGEHAAFATHGVGVEIEQPVTLA